MKLFNKIMMWLDLAGVGLMTYFGAHDLARHDWRYVAIDAGLWVALSTAFLSRAALIGYMREME